MERLLLRDPLQRVLRRLQREGNAGAGQILADDGMLAALEARVQKLAEESPPDAGARRGGKLLTWIMTHKMQILQFIVLILELFSMMPLLPKQKPPKGS